MVIAAAGRYCPWSKWVTSGQPYMKVKRTLEVAVTFRSFAGVLFRISAISLFLAVAVATKGMQCLNYRYSQAGSICTQST